MNNHSRLLSVAVSLTALVSLSGCLDPGTGPVAATPTTVNGVAAKGIVKQARVLVCRIVNGVPEADATCATGTTGSDGSFSVTMNDGYTGPAMVKVMANTSTMPGAASMMSDEITGSDIPYHMTMRAVLPSIAATTTAYVTPFSEMAAAGVGMSGIDALGINRATTTVQSMMTNFGVDLSVKPMMDLQANGSNTTMLSMQSNMVKQLARVMMAARNASGLTDANGVPCNAAGTTTDQQVACAIAAMSRVMTGGSTINATQQAVVLAALNSQTPTTVTMPIIKADGTLVMQMADMTSSTSMQAAMQRAGMTTTTATNTTQVTMPMMR